MPTTTPSDPRQMTGQVLGEAARRMLPVLAGKLLTAVVDRAVARVDELAERLEDRDGPAPRDRSDDAAGAEAGPPSRAGTALAFLAEQVRVALAIVVRLAAQALEMLRRATERLRARRAPEGIDAEAEALDDDTDDDGEYLEGEYWEDEDAEPAMAAR